MRLSSKLWDLPAWIFWIQGVCFLLFMDFLPWIMGSSWNEYRWWAHLRGSGRHLCRTKSARNISNLGSEVSQNRDFAKGVAGTVSLPTFSVFLPFFPFLPWFFQFSSFFPFLSVSFRFFRFLSVSFRFFPSLSVSFRFFPFLSVSFVSFSGEKKGRYRSQDPFCKTPIKNKVRYFPFGCFFCPECAKLCWRANLPGINCPGGAGAGASGRRSQASHGAGWDRQRHPRHGGWRGGSARLP